MIAVPTTCGAGSEVSNVSIAEFTKLHTKMGLAVDEIYADRAVLIPELLTGLPYSFLRQVRLMRSFMRLNPMYRRKQLYIHRCSV